MKKSPTVAFNDENTEATIGRFGVPNLADRLREHMWLPPVIVRVQ